ncbi:MAG: heat-inducible transcriptional repressor HrcA [Candidatus Hydrogenedentes bacterium]|nr:heat-inducible transcriptional repressor HrcA [Candidatus Hydrogenedentota bacterium]
MPHSKLTEREQLILQAVVHLYITTAEPVGSRAIVKRFELDISPATVRNVMADLEDMGFLQQLHTSSGRIPTDNGYRHYVDCLMSIQELTQSERSRIESHLTDQLNDADAVLRQTSYLLALISHQTSIVEAPALNVALVEHVEIVPIGEQRLAFLLADNYGGVRTMVLQTSKRITPDDAQRLNRFLNEHFRHTPIDAFSSSLESKLHAFIDEQRRLAEQALDLLQLLPDNQSGRLFLEGTTQLFEQPEFHDVDKVREVFGLLEERDRIAGLLRAGILNPKPHPSRVVIGSEAHQVGFEELSLVSAPYEVDGKTVGMLGVLGPRRMSYSRLSGLVEYTASRLGNLLTRFAR